MELAIQSFIAGELSPHMMGRTDLAEYYQGCREVTNMVVLPTGGVARRPGFEHVTTVYNNSYRSRLIPYVAGTDRYMLEFAYGYMRVFKDGDLVMDGAAAYKMAHPYTAAEMRDVHVAAGGEILTHPDRALRYIRREDDDDWETGGTATRYGPFRAENDDTAFTLTPSAATGRITLTASKDLFDDAMEVSSLFRLLHDISEQTIEYRYTVSTTSSTFTVLGRWDLLLTGAWAGTVQLQRSVNGTAWTDVRYYSRDIPSNDVIEDAGEETELDILYRLVYTKTSEPTSGLPFEEWFRWRPWYWDDWGFNWQMQVEHGQQVGLVSVWSVTSAKVATVDVLQTLGGTGATYKWQESAWSAYRGYPACCAVHDGRIMVANTATNPRTVWASRPFLELDDTRVWDQGTTVEDDDALARTISSQNCNEIRWLASLWPLLIGSDAGVLKAVGADDDAPITAFDFNVSTQNGAGACNVQPQDISGRVCYVGRDLKSVYEMVYSNDRHVYEPLELTRYREHICGDGIVEWAVMQRPYQIIFAVTDDGDLIGLTRYTQSESHQAIIACHRHTTDGTFESVAVLPGDGGGDELWVSVARTVDGSTYRTIEKMKPFDWGSSQRDCFFVDGGTTWDGGAAATITDISVDGVTNKVTVTAATHGFEDGYTVKITSVVGMTDVNGKVYTVADKAANTFVLKTRNGSGYIDGSEFSDYTSGGSVERVANSVTGLTQLASEDVVALHDGQPATGTVNASGVYTIGSRDRHYFNTIHVGRPYSHAVSPMRPEARTRDGVISGLKKKVTNVHLRLYESAGGSVGESETDEDLAEINYTDRGDAANADVELFTGDRQLDFPGGWTRGGDLWIGGSEPLPFTLLSILYGLEV